MNNPGGNPGGVNGIYGNNNFAFGTGAFESTSDLPQAANFYGMPDWWSVPFSWYSKVDKNYQIFVSPTWDFSKWVFAVKINNDGGWVFQSRGFTLFGVPSDLQVTFPPS